MDKLKQVIRFDSIPVTKGDFDEQGFLHDTPVVTSVGIFEYATEDGGVRRELRLPEHVFDPDSLASYEGRPVIITHNAGRIDKENVMDEIVGTILSKGYQDGNDVRCKIVIHDIDKVKKLPFRELSLGYSLDLIEEPGEWKGQHYDAVQTNIRINHLAIVENARAGEQAHLNLDSKRVGLDDRKIQEGGQKGMYKTNVHADGFDMTPEELCEAIKQYRASKEAKEEPTADALKDAPKTPVAETEEKDDAEAKESPETPFPASEAPYKVEESEKGTDQVDELITALEKFLETLKASKNADCDDVTKADSEDEKLGIPDEEENQDSEEEDEELDEKPEKNDDSDEDESESKAQAMNADSVDAIISQKLSLCRVGDKLHLDGLERKSLLDGKKAIIKKVLPEMRLDGKSRDYINAAYDIAVSKVGKRKDVDYQRQQMASAAPYRVDGADNMSMATSARQRMIEREGGNE